MDILLMVTGLLSAVVSLILSIIAIVDGTSKTAAFLLLIASILLIKIGRGINRKKKK